MARRTDKFANVASAEVVESAANTVTFQEVRFGVGIGQRKGLIVDQIDYYIAPAVFATSFAADADTLVAAWTTRNDLSSIIDQFDNRAVLHLWSMRMSFTTSGLQFPQFPVQHQFAPPLIVAPRAGALYLAVQGLNAPAAHTVQSRMYFRFEDLSQSDFLELAEAFDLVG
jgi:hypothetical protein